MVFYSRMPDTIGLLFAGQGSQAVGMGRSLADTSPKAAELFAQADRILNRPLAKLMFEGPIEELTLTANCQPALFVHGLAVLAALEWELGDFPSITAAAGLSLGEFTAHAAVGTFDFATGLKLVEARGRYMEEACLETAGAMAAVIGADENVVRGFAADMDVDIANLNAPGQIVISGEQERIAMSAAMAREAGIRKIVALNVAGAYHSRLMESAYVKLGAELMHTVFQPPNYPVICNVDARPVETPDAVRRTLAEQVTGTVCWQASIEYMIDTLGCNLFLELGPDEKLAGMVRRIRSGTEVLSVSDPVSLTAAVARLKRAE